MTRLEKENLFDIAFLANLQSNPSQTIAAFVKTTGSVSTNDYRSNIYTIDAMSHTIKQLTAMDQEKSFLWISDEELIFPAARHKEAVDQKSKGVPYTAFYRIGIHGGEAQFDFSVPYSVAAMKVLGEDDYLFLVNDDLQAPEYTGDSDAYAKAYLDYKENTSRFDVYDELPFRANGKGIVNKIRARLYRVRPQKSQYTLISPAMMTVTDFSIDQSSQMVYFSGEVYTSVMQQVSELYQYSMQDERTCQIDLPEAFMIELTRKFPSFLLIYGTPASRVNSYANACFYRFDPADGSWSVLNDLDVSVGSSIGSDTRYGANTAVRVSQDKLYYKSARGRDSFVFELDSTGSEVCVSAAIAGSVDGFDWLGHQLLVIASRNHGLPELYLSDSKRPEVQLSDFNQAFLSAYSLSTPESFDFETADGCRLEGFVLKPVDYQSGGSYPGILTIHGGPKAIYGDIFVFEMQLLAAQGYFVFFTNPRGSDGRGSEFANIEGERYGTMDYQDLMTFTDEVIQRYPALDETRLGVTGGSYGGLMTNWIVGHTDRFKAAVTQRSIANYVTKCLTTDIGYYHNLHQMGGATPWSDESVLWDHSPLKYADRVKTPLLFLHSDEDYRCYMGDALQFFTALKMFGVETRFVLFHHENHELSRSGQPKNRMSRYQELIDWMNRFLK